MAEVVTRTDLENARLDLKTVEDVVNGAEDFGGDGLVHSRLGRDIKTFAKVTSELLAPEPFAKAGDGSTVSFTLPVAPGSAGSVEVYISGIHQAPSTYSVSGTTLTFTEAPPTPDPGVVANIIGMVRHSLPIGETSAALVQHAGASPRPGSATLKAELDHLFTAVPVATGSVADLAADLTLTYTPGTPSSVAVGDLVRVHREQFVYEVVASPASKSAGGYHVSTAGGVLLKALPLADGVLSTRQFEAAGDDITDDTAAVQLATATMDLYGGGELRFQGMHRITGTIPVVRNSMEFVGLSQAMQAGTTFGSPSGLRWDGGETGTMFKFGDGGTTTVQGIGIRSMRLDGGGTDCIAVLCDEVVTDSRWMDVEITDMGIGFLMRRSCFAHRWFNVRCKDFKRFGWDLQELNHNSVFIACKGWGSSLLSPTATVRIGLTQHSSQVTFDSCDFEAWNVPRQIQAIDVNALSIRGCYFEAKNANTVYIVELGATTPKFVDAWNISASRAIGNMGGASVIREVNANNGYLGGGNEFAAFTGPVMQVVNAGTKSFGENKITGLTLASSYTSSQIWSSERIGAWGASGQTSRPAVTGSRGGNAALASFLTAMDTYGFIDDQTTA